MVGTITDDNVLQHARAALPSAINSLPANYLDKNAAPLILVIEELKKSLLLELRVIETIRNLDLSESSEAVREKVAQTVAQLDSYAQQRFFDAERTHCHNIDLIVRELIAPLRMPVAYDEKRINETLAILKPLGDADADFLDELAPLLTDVVARAKLIDGQVRADRFEDAREELEKFDKDVAARLKRLKSLLMEMSTLVNDLLARL